MQMLPRSCRPAAARRVQQSPLQAAPQLIASTRSCNPSSRRPAGPGSGRHVRVRSSSSSSSDAPGDQRGGEEDGASTSAAAQQQPLLPWETEAPPLPPNYASIQANLGHMDCNQLQTALGVAIAAEDYVLANRIKDRLQAKLLESGSAVISKPMDWRALGVPDWLADRAERVGFLFPTEVQRRSTPVILSGADAVIASETGSGKTGAFLVPALAQLDYPPDLFPEDLEGPQLLVLVPSFELGVQACMLLYKLWGGNISSRTPGDPANMFSYTGPAGIKVRGVLNDEEVQMAAGSRYLRGVHALVATPDMALALLSLPDSPLSLQDLRVVAVDEMDALLDAYPASFGQLLDAAVKRYVPPGFTQGAAATQGLTAVGLDDVPEGQGGSSGSDASAGGGGGDAAGSEDDAAQQQQNEQGPAGSGAADNLARLKALLDEQQRRKQQQGAGAPASGEAGSGSSASMAAAAARLEGLLAAPAVPGAADASQQQPAASSDAEQQQGVAADAAGVDAGASSSSDAATAAAAAAAAGEDDTPMPKPQVVLVGATISEQDIALALSRGWIADCVEVRVGAEGCVPAGLTHKAIVVGQAQQRLGGLVASLRQDLTGELAAADAAAAAAEAARSTQSQQQQPVRVIVFARSEDEARSAAEPLRAALWGEHMLAVLLPSTGAEPVKALTAFRDRVASLLLATPSAARGLDLPAISHVYSLGLPADATEYVHRAGRAGRIGSTAGGEVVSVVTREELPELLGMVTQELGLHLEVVDLEAGQQQQQQGEQQGSGLGLLGRDYAAAREGLLQDGSAEEGAGSGEQQQQQSEGGEPQDGKKEQQLEAARKGLEDLFNLL